MKYCFGADIGGTAVKIGFFNKDGELLEKWEIPTRKEEKGAYVLQDLANAIKGKMEEKGIKMEEVIGVGLDAPGPVSEDGVIHGCVNIGWGTFHFVEEFKSLTGFQVVRAENDAKVAALGEHWKGVCQGDGSMVMVTLGTGVGGGVVLNGQLHRGINGAAGEIGHMVVQPEETEFCNCGKRGCLEQIASATGIVRTAKRFMDKDTKPSKLRELEMVTAKNVLDLAAQGDALALEVVEYVCKYLGMALANVSCVVDTDMIVIGGGVSKAGRFLVDKIQKYHYDFAFEPSKVKRFEIAKLGNDAGIYGCARLILEGKVTENHL